MRGLWSASCGGLLAVALGCGGSNGGSGTAAEKFVGVWKGNSIVTAGGQSNNVQTTIPIEQVDPSTVRLHGFCGSGADIYADGPKAAVNGNSFTLDPGSCTYSTANCSSVMLQVVSGNGVLSTGLPPTLTVAVSANFSGCGNGVSETVTFTASTRQPYGSTARAPDDPAALGWVLDLR